MSAKPSVSIRAKVSDTPPGLVGEMIRTGLVGQSAAAAICERLNPTATIAKMRRCMSNSTNTARPYKASLRVPYAHSGAAILRAFHGTFHFPGTFHFHVRFHAL